MHYMHYKDYIHHLAAEKTPPPLPGGGNHLAGGGVGSLVIYIYIYMYVCMYVCIYNYAGHKRCCPLVSSNLVSNRGSEIIVALHPFLSEDLYRRRRNGQ